ncbi:MAG: hypothetical protein K0S32_3588 [Bacteroidetes bacterium]|jgi:hypothetical protein|nr:hypothetical protein [Bacteroidota bacterium]
MDQNKNNGIKPQEVITIFCDIKQKDTEQQWVDYPQLFEFFNKGYYIESFKQSIIGSDRYMITFTFRSFNAATY